MLPIVLSHGVCRFDLLNPFLRLDETGPDSVHYFRNIKTAIQTAYPGVDVYHSEVGWASSVEDRAIDLRKWIETNLPKDTRFHIIAHSMGGLDARHMLFNSQNDGFYKRVASVNTIGTPHLGTSFADWGIAHLSEIIKFTGFFGLNLAGLYDLTTTATTEFNNKAASFENSNPVIFRTYAGAVARQRVFWPLRESYDIILKSEGDNDGLVSVKSATWKQTHFIAPTIEADHLNEIGWWQPADGFAPIGKEIQDFYCNIVSNFVDGIKIVQ